MGFSRQEYWSGLPCPPPRDLTDLRITLGSPAVQATWVRSLGREDSLEMEMATHSSILAWRIPWMEEPGGLQSMGSKESDTTERLHFHSFTFISSHRTGKGQFSVQSQRRAMPKNVQTTAQLNSSHTLAK